jgi:hypothetical protein
VLRSIGHITGPDGLPVNARQGFGALKVELFPHRAAWKHPVTQIGAAGKIAEMRES